jgi:hypothetical protein
VIVYFDTSAFVKMFLVEHGSEIAKVAWETAPTTASSLLLYPEARSALARARREGREVTVAPDDTPAVLDERMLASHVVTPTYRLVREAGAMAETRALRGFDAVHLASALQTGPQTVVVTADKRLAEAAEAEGLVVLLAA